MPCGPVDGVFLQQLPKAAAAQQAAAITLLQKVVSAPQWEPMSWGFVATQHLGGCAYEAYCAHLHVYKILGPLRKSAGARPLYMGHSLVTGFTCYH